MFEIKKYFTTSVVIAALAVNISACNWVKTSEEAGEVALIKPALAQHCERLGVTTAKVKSKLGPVSRDDTKVQDELVAIAKNEAALIGGDAVVAEGIAEGGVQRFSIYRCPEK